MKLGSCFVNLPGIRPASRILDWDGPTSRTQPQARLPNSRGFVRINGVRASVGAAGALPTATRHICLQLHPPLDLLPQEEALRAQLRQAACSVRPPLAAAHHDGSLPTRELAHRPDRSARHVGPRQVPIAHTSTLCRRRGHGKLYACIPRVRLPAALVAVRAAAQRLWRRP